MRSQWFAFLLIAALVVGCSSPASETTSPTPPVPAEPTPIPTSPPDPMPETAAYGFPDSIDPARRYLFYLHGRIIEEQGIPAVSPDYGEYEYAAILEKLASYDFDVISEPRAVNTDAIEYAQKVVGQIDRLLEANVPPEAITVVGASKGAGIAIYVSHLLENENVNFVLLAICNGNFVEQLQQNQVFLYGRVLSIYDYTDDEYAGPCTDLFSSSAENGGLTEHNEIVLEVGTGHGVLYHPLDEWILPTVQWAK